MMGVAYLLKLCHSEREARVKGQKREDTKKFIEHMNNSQSSKSTDSDISTAQSSPDKQSNLEVELMLKKKFVEI